MARSAGSQISIPRTIRPWRLSPTTSPIAPSPTRIAPVLRFGEKPGTGLPSSTNHLAISGSFDASAIHRIVTAGRCHFVRWNPIENAGFLGEAQGGYSPDSNAEARMSGAEKQRLDED